MKRALSALIWVSFTLVGCRSIPPYRPSAPAPASPSQSAGRGVEIQPGTPPEQVPPAQPLPSPPSREYSLGPASKALVAQAHSQANSRNYALAASTIERALRIEPNNPLLWIEYGQVRMAENNYAQAESMARKALATATGDYKTQAAAWRLLADSYRARDRNNDAREAEAKANALAR